MDTKYLNIKEAAKLLGVSALTLRNWDNSGKFPAGRHPISNYRVYKKEDIDELLSQMGVKSGSRRAPKNEIKKLNVNHLN